MKQKKFDWAYAAAVLLPVAILAIWEITVKSGILRASLLPAPSTIGKALVKNFENGTLQNHILISVSRVIKGYLAGSATGIVLGVFMGLLPWFRKSLSVLTGILRPIPIIAWVPILILFLGIGTFWPVLTNVMYGVRDVDLKYLEVAAIMKKSKWEIIRSVVFPAALPTIFSGLRTAIGIAWISVVGAELIASSSGLGYMISYAREMSWADNMFAGVIMIGLIGWGINIFIGWLEKFTVRWSDNVKNS